LDFVGLSIFSDYPFGIFKLFFHSGIISFDLQKNKNFSRFCLIPLVSLKQIISVLFTRSGTIKCNPNYILDLNTFSNSGNLKGWFIVFNANFGKIKGHITRTEKVLWSKIEFGLPIMVQNGNSFNV
jgi:hypothetical protein